MIKYAQFSKLNHGRDQSLRIRSAPRLTTDSRNKESDKPLRSMCLVKLIN